MHSERVLFFFLLRFLSLLLSLSHVTIGLGCGGRLQAVFPSFFFFRFLQHGKSVWKQIQICSFPRSCLRGSRGLDEDSTVSVEFEDLAQPLLGRGHPFFGPLALKKKESIECVNGID